MLDDTVREELLSRYQQMLTSGELMSQEKLERYYKTFRDRFGTERLMSVDGEALLEMIHDHSTKDSLTYWLEFKNDDEFPAAFGSIAGGSALKFGIYKRKETGLWMTGTSKNQKQISVEEAIGFAREYRDELIRGVKLLEQLPLYADDTEYERLQEAIDRVAPRVSNLAWGHKYFSLLFPDKIDDYHNADYQRFHLIKLGIEPPELEGRYACAGRYVAMARELEMPLNHLTSVLNARDGNPHRYWKVLVNYNFDGWRDRWPGMVQQGMVSIGWQKVGDLSGLGSAEDARGRIKQLMKEQYNEKGSWATEVFYFSHQMQQGDVVLAFEANRVLGIGRVVGDYVYEPDVDEGAPHRRSVEWLSDESWELPVQERAGRVVRTLNEPQNLVAIERKLSGAEVLQPAATAVAARTQPKGLKGIAGQIQSVLARKKQVVLYGPPGTGKTFWAKTAVYDLAAISAFGKVYRDLSADERSVVTGDEQRIGLVSACTFHPAYGYEDFIEGFRPAQSEGGALVFERRAGLFKALCETARGEEGRSFYLIIDEINRGDIPRIFGELLTLLEADKRGTELRLPVSGELFSVPPNVFLVGTMNTADRSIALLDTALRRRFGFIELMPDSEVLGDAVVGRSLPLGPWLDALNRRIVENIGRDARNLQIGHAYLLDKGRPISEFFKFIRVLQEDIIPLLQEYCYEDYRVLERILGPGLIDGGEQRVKSELLSINRQAELLQALISGTPEVVDAVFIDEQNEEADEDAEAEEAEDDQEPTP